MHQVSNFDDGQRSVLTILRSLNPARRLTLAEALQIAELQAARLVELQGIDDLPVADEVVTSLPRVVVRADGKLPPSVSGCSDWDSYHRTWVITVNSREPRTRQRFTMLHEYKHIIDHSSIGLSAPKRMGFQVKPEEFLADYFAGCVLMPRRALKAVWASGTQDPLSLAQIFDVSVRAMEVRLRQIGLLWDDAVEGSPGPRSTPSSWHRYFRRNSSTGQVRPLEAVS